METKKNVQTDKEVTREELLKENKILKGQIDVLLKDNKKLFKECGKWQTEYRKEQDKTKLEREAKNTLYHFVLMKDLLTMYEDFKQEHKGKSYEELHLECILYLAQKAGLV